MGEDAVEIPKEMLGKEGDVYKLSIDTEPSGRNSLGCEGHLCIREVDRTEQNTKQNLRLRRRWTIEITAWTFAKVSMGRGNNADLLWRTTVFLTAKPKGWIFCVMDDSEALRERTFQANCGTAPLRMICYCRRQQAKCTLPSSAGRLPGVTPQSHPQATLSVNISTGAYFLYPAEQQSSMWFWNSHVYPSNPYQYSVTCMWISGPYLTQGNRSLWKRIPNVTASKHVLLLQQAWGLQEPLESTDFNESLSLGRHNSNHVCLCCYRCGYHWLLVPGISIKVHNSSVLLSPDLQPAVRASLHSPCHWRSQRE